MHAYVCALALGVRVHVGTHVHLYVAALVCAGELLFVCLLITCYKPPQPRIGDRIHSNEFHYNVFLLPLLGGIIFPSISQFATLPRA